MSQVVKSASLGSTNQAENQQEYFKADKYK